MKQIHSLNSTDPKNQWVAPFIGNDDLFLLDVINDMDQKRSSPVRRNLKTDQTGKDQSPNDMHHYMNQVSIIQSSGSGKSRLVDQVAQRIFTIPINLRDPKESESG
jgi:ABC-type Fe3+/spermidine/putrescine transport system ATPase subunit